MTESPSVPAPAETVSRRWGVARAVVPGLLISVAATSWVAMVVGANLGLFLGALLLTTCYVPAVVLAESGQRRWIALAGIMAGACLSLAIFSRSIDVTFGEWLQCALVLEAYAWALAGVAVLLWRIHLPVPIAALLVVVIGLLWLTWGVWLSPWMTQGLADWLSPANPLLATNAIVRHLGTWDHAPIAYKALTVLDQDVPYRLPRTILPAVLLHILIGTPGMALSFLRDRTEATINSSHAPPTPPNGR